MEYQTRKEPDPSTLYGVWYYIYGDGSHLNLAGKLLIAAPLFPVVAAFVLWLWLLNALFTKR